MKKLIYMALVLLLTGTFLHAETEKNSSFSLGKYGTFAFKKMNDNVYIMHGPVVAPDKENRGFMNNPAVIVGKSGLIVIDPGGNYNVGKHVLAEIEKVSKKPILAVFNTHKHGDHWFANKAIIEKYPKVVIYADEKMISEVKNGEAEKWYGILDKLTGGNLKGTKAFAYPTKALHNGDKVTVDGEVFVVRHPKAAHTDTDLLIEHVNSKTLFLGDNVMKGRFGAFDASSSILGNIALLEALKKEKALKLYVPGHGLSGEKDETLDPYLHYLKVIEQEVRKAYEDDKEAFEVKDAAIEKLKAYEKWDGFEYTLGRHMGKLYQEIELQDM